MAAVVNKNTLGGLKIMVKLLIIIIACLAYSVKSNEAISLLNALEPDNNSIEEVHLKSALASLEVSSACSNDSSDYIAALESLLPTSKRVNDNAQWAMQLLDATGKIPTGILEGNLNWLGSFTECLKTRAYKGNSSAVERFRGQYCTANLEPSNGTTPKFNQMRNPLTNAVPATGLPVGWQLGVCWPSSCNRKEIQLIVNQLLKILRLKVKTLPDFKVIIAPNVCHVRADGSKIDAVSIVVIVVYSLFALLILSATIFELVCKYKHEWSGSIQSIDYRQQGCSSTSGVVARVLLAFSAYKNGKKILIPVTSDTTLTCIHGIRFLSMAWVVLCHTYAIGMILPFKNAVAILDVLKSYAMQIVLNGSFSVDTFYTISGLLVTYLFLHEMTKSGGQFGLKQLFLFYFHRYWRLTPAYAMGIAFIVGIWYHLGDGPLWTHPLEEQTNCRMHWWRNLLYIQNLYGTYKCYDVSWYLGTDMQFYVISLPILVALYRMPIVGLILMAIYFAITTITTALIIYIRDLPSSIAENILHADPVRNHDYAEYVYPVPWCRMGPYLIGMFTGYILFQNRGLNNRLRPIMVIGGWLAAAILGLTLIFGYRDVINGDVIMARGVRALNGAGSRSAWGAVVCWVIYACVTGHGGYVNTILSWKALVPLSRLTYSAYLVHAYVLEGLYATQETNYYFNQYLIIIFFLGFLALTMGVAFLFSLAFEAPMMELEKIFLPRRKVSSSKNDDDPLLYLEVDDQHGNPNDPHA